MWVAVIVHPTLQGPGSARTLGESRVDAEGSQAVPRRTGRVLVAGACDDPPQVLSCNGQATIVRGRNLFHTFCTHNYTVTASGCPPRRKQEPVRSPSRRSSLGR